MICTLKKATLVFVAISAYATGCGGGSGGIGNDGGTTSGGTSGVTGSKKLPDLTDADKKVICDWTASFYGGYGKSIDCGTVGGMSLTLQGPTSQAECLAESSMLSSTCQATVAQSEACIKAGANCDQTSMDTACAALWACLSTAP